VIDKEGVKKRVEEKNLKREKTKARKEDRERGLIMKTRGIGGEKSYRGLTTRDRLQTTCSTTIDAEVIQNLTEGEL